MDGSIHRGPVEPPFGCKPRNWNGSGWTGPETDGPITPPAGGSCVQLVTAANEPRQPRYVAEGREVVNVHRCARWSPPRARDELKDLYEAVLATTYESLVETDLLVIADLVKAIRQAERADPTPPASIARAA